MPYVLAALALGLAASTANAGPSPFPTTTRSRPSACPTPGSPKPYEGGVEATSADGTIYIAIEEVAADDVKSAVEEGLKFFLKSGVEIDFKSQKTHETSRSTASTPSTCRSPARTRTVPTNISLTLVQTNAKSKFLMLYYWGSPEGREGQRGRAQGHLRQHPADQVAGGTAVAKVNACEGASMRYQISGTVMQTVAIDLSPGETVYSQTNTMAWMNDRCTMDTHTGGGLFAGLKRSFGGGSFFITDFTASGAGHVAFAPRFPGTIVPALLQPGQSLICRKETFLVAQKSVTLELAWQKRLGAGFFGGDGFILQKVTGPGVVWLDLSGELVERDLAPGERLLVHAGHVGVFEPSVGFDIQMVQRLQEHPVRRRGPVPRDADRPRPHLAAEHADPQPRRGDRPLSAAAGPTAAPIRPRAASPPARRSARRAACSAACWEDAIPVRRPRSAPPSGGDPENASGDHRLDGATKERKRRALACAAAIVDDCRLEGFERVLQGDDVLVEAGEKRVSARRERLLPKAEADVSRGDRRDRARQGRRQRRKIKADEHLGVDQFRILRAGDRRRRGRGAPIGLDERIALAEEARQLYGRWTQPNSIILPPSGR